jgi:hypothetical protein
MTKTDLKLFLFLLLCIILLGMAEAVSHSRFTSPAFSTHQGQKGSSEVEAPVVEKTYVPQFVLVSFDGSRQLEIWKMISDLEDELGQSGTRLDVTHFINAAYFLTPQNRHLYKGPGQIAGKTNIGVSEDLEHVKNRILEVNKAIAHGDEIAVHTVGHFSGLHWSKEDWLSELDQFNLIMFGLNKMYSNETMPKINLAADSMVGFRAPYLDHGNNLFEALHVLPGYRYDSSEVGDGVSWPTKDGSGLWHIPLGMMTRGENKRNVLVMDYNWYEQDTHVTEKLKRGTPEWQHVYDETLKGLKDYFLLNYRGNRAPVLIGYHFETWNDGVYWEVLKTFVKQVCGRQEVRCGTFKELVNYLDTHGVPSK